MSIARTLRPRRKLAAGALIATVALTAGPALATPAAAEAPRPFGPACAKVPASGPGSVADMANQPVATAAARNPLLSTLATAVGKAGLSDTLNRAEALTVFAPTNDAFAKLPPATLNKVLADKKSLTSILTYHVVGARQTPADLADGRFTVRRCRAAPSPPPRRARPTR